MAKPTLAAAQQAAPPDLANYQRDAEASLRLYFTSGNPKFSSIFAGDLPSEVAERLADRIRETDLRAALVTMASIEAAFRRDYEWRRKAKKADAVSVAFRNCPREHPHLNEDIWQAWRNYSPSTRELIGQLRSAFRFRHWLAHGRYWRPGRQYDFQTIYLLAQAVDVEFPLHT